MSDTDRPVDFVYSADVSALRKGLQVPKHVRRRVRALYWLAIVRFVLALVGPPIGVFLAYQHLSHNDFTGFGGLFVALLCLSPWSTWGQNADR